MAKPGRTVIWEFKIGGGGSHVGGVFWGCFLGVFSGGVFWGCFLGVFEDDLS
jgi:hypothetical protein